MFCCKYSAGNNTSYLQTCVQHLLCGSNVLKITTVQRKLILNSRQTSLFSREVKTVPTHLSELLKLKKKLVIDRVI